MNSTISRPQTVRIFVIESQVLLAKALCQVLAQDDVIDVVGDSESINPNALKKAAPDLIVLDCDHDLSQLQVAIGDCRSELPNVRVCVLSTHLSADVMLRALSAGADGYLVKDITPAELVASIKAIATGGFYADPRLSGTLLRRHAQKNTRDVAELSPRELDVVRLIAQGLSNKEISQRLLLSDKTIKNHISNIFSKLNLTARTQVAVHAIRHGLV